MKSVDGLTKTTISGRRFTRKQLEEIQETVTTFKNLSLQELANTLCEHLNWTTPKGTTKVNSCLTLLYELEKQGIVLLPAKREAKSPTPKQIVLQPSDKDKPIEESLEAIGPIELETVTSKEDRLLWKAYVQAYHYLGYKQSVGNHICYFIVSKSLNQKLGCLLFTASAAWSLADRDIWIGWEKKHRRKLLHLILNNSRFLIFPWVNVPNLASTSLSIATKQISDDFMQVHKYRPVLIETFVDTTRYSGTCYQAANWQHLGKTKGRGRFDPEHNHPETIKEIFVHPLQSNFRHILTNFQQTKALKKKYRNDLLLSNTLQVEDSFVRLWENVIQIINEVASCYDKVWQIRKRVINTIVLILLIFRLVCSKNTQSYGTTIDELWDNCNKLKIPLPQKNSIAPSSFCDARKKLNEIVFKSLNHKIIETYASWNQDKKEQYQWYGHNLFAVDGSKVNLPRALLKNGYALPSDNSYYPQGLLSCLYHLKTQIPVDFELVNHGNERLCAEKHLKALKKGDVVVYDRGYFSYIMLHQHIKSEIHAIFRLQENSFTVINQFFLSQDKDILTTIYPSSTTKRDILKAYPKLDLIPIKFRLIKYEINENIYCLGTTLVDQDKYNNIQDFMDIYHDRWGIEELYKISKRLFIFEDFHSKSDRGVKQEIYAHFNLITMNRIFSNQTDRHLNQMDNLLFTNNTNPDSAKHAATITTIKRIKTNFKNCLHVFARSLEGLILLQEKIKTTVEQALHFIVGQYQKVRPNRSYIRKSMKPDSRWRSDKKKKQVFKEINVTA